MFGVRPPPTPVCSPPSPPRLFDSSSLRLLDSSTPRLVDSSLWTLNSGFELSPPDGLLLKTGGHLVGCRVERLASRLCDLARRLDLPSAIADAANGNTGEPLRFHRAESDQLIVPLGQHRAKKCRDLLADVEIGRGQAQGFRVDGAHL